MGMIFLDLDGVCCDFVGHILNMAGKEEKDYIEILKSNPDAHPYNLLEWLVGRDGDHFWTWIEMLGSEFWHTMPAFSWFDRLYDGLKQISDVHFLTSAPKMPSAYHGKALWVERNAGKEAVYNLIVCQSRMKRALSAPGRFLVDDTKRNVEEWNEAGGVCFNFPSLQFHHRHPTDKDIDDVLNLAKMVLLTGDC